MNATLLHQALRAAGVVIAAALALVALYVTVPLIYPFIIGWLVAYMLNPLVGLMQYRLKFPRWLSVTVAILLFIGAIGGLITVVVIRIAREMERLAQLIDNNYAKWLENLDKFRQSELLQGLTNRINALYEGTDYQDTVNLGIHSAGQKVAGAIADALQSLAGMIIGFIAALPNLALGIVVAFLAAWFISKDWKRISAWLLSFIPDSMKASVDAVWTDLRKALFGFLRAQFILVSITTVFVIIGLLLLRVPYAVTIGLLIGLVDILPYLGTGAVFVPWILYALVEGSYAFAFGLAVLYGIIVIARQLAEPKIYSSSIGLNPLATLIAIFVGLKLFGFFGLIIGPVLLVIAFSLHRADVFRDLRRFIKHGRAGP